MVRFEDLVELERCGIRDRLDIEDVGFVEEVEMENGRKRTGVGFEPVFRRACCL